MRHSFSVMTKHANTEQSKWFYCEVRKSVTAAVSAVCVMRFWRRFWRRNRACDASKLVVSGPVASFFGQQQQQCSSVGKVVQSLEFSASISNDFWFYHISNFFSHTSIQICRSIWILDLNKHLRFWRRNRACDASKLIVSGPVASFFGQQQCSW